MAYRASWEKEGADWPYRAFSRFVQADRLRWHVQVLGQAVGTAPVLLLVHGTGAATHSWAPLVPYLEDRFTLVIPDLPGHGFTHAPVSSRLSLPGMARGLGRLLDELGLKPDLAVGHSAGAAILIRMALDGTIDPKGLVSLAGALEPYPGSNGPVMSTLARVLFLNPVVPWAFSLRARSDSVIDNYLKATGSKLTETRTYYARLARTPAHAGAALGMMANWDLEPLQDGFKDLKVPLLLVSGHKDGMIAESVGEMVAGKAPHARHVVLQGLGHLAHEEDPAGVAALLLDFADEVMGD